MRPPRLVHTGVSDDLDLMLDALAPEPGRRFVTLSAHGAGENALALAARGAEVLAYDVADGAALERIVALKRGAARLLGREDYLAVMGLRPASRLRRVALAKQVIRGLDGADRDYWAPRQAWLVEGLFHADRVSRFVRAFVRGLKLLGGADRDLLLGAGTEAERRAAFARAVRRGWLERLLAEVGGRVNLFFPEAEWTASEYPKLLNRAPLGYLEDLVAAGLTDSVLFGPAVRPRDAALPQGLLPPHLRPGAFDGLRPAAGARIRVVPGPAGAVPDLGEAPVPLDGAYLSNVVDYLDGPARARLFADLVPRLGPGAPVLVYSNEAYGKVPSDLELDEAATATLGARDRARIYARVELWRRPGTAPPTRGPAPSLKVIQ